MITDIMIVLILLLIAGASGWYLYRAKKRGEHCVGCPHAKLCKKTNCQCSSETNGHSKET